MMAPRPKRWSITMGGTLPRLNPGMLTDFATSAYALSILGLRSANGTSTVILTRVGLNCSTVLGTLVTPDDLWRADGRRDCPGWLTLSRGNPTGRAQGGQTSMRPIPGRTVTSIF